MNYLRLVFNTCWAGWHWVKIVSTRAACSVVIPSNNRFPCESRGILLSGLTTLDQSGGVVRYSSWYSAALTEIAKTVMPTLVSKECENEESRDPVNPVQLQMDILGRESTM